MGILSAGERVRKKKIGGRELKFLVSTSCIDSLFEALEGHARRHLGWKKSMF